MKKHVIIHVKSIDFSSANYMQMNISDFENKDDELFDANEKGNEDLLLLLNHKMVDVDIGKTAYWIEVKNYIKSYIYEDNIEGEDIEAVIYDPIDIDDIYQIIGRLVNKGMVESV